MNKTREAKCLSDIGALCCNFCCSGKTKSIICSEFVFMALVILQAKRMRPILYYHLTPIAHPHRSLKQHEFLKHVIEHKMFVLIFSRNLSVIILVLIKIHRGIVTNVLRFPC